MSSTNVLLEIKNLRKNYSRAGCVFSAIDNVSFTVKTGEFVAIMGRSGSGKTTLLNLISGLLTPSNGSIIIEQTDIFSLNDQQAAKFRNQHLGYTPQGNSLLSALTALDNIRLPAYLGEQKVQPDLVTIAQALMEQAGIAYLTNTYPAHMSGGELRRVAIVRALIQSPKLLIVDEPTNDLDSASANEVIKLLDSYHASGGTLLIVTHDNKLANHSDRLLFLTEGKLHEQL